MSRFDITGTEIPGLTKIARKPRADERGSFTRMFCAGELAAAGWRGDVKQINMAANRLKGTLRGMHYQTGAAAEAKLVMCLKGAVLDVAVDIRTDSPAFLRSAAVELSAENMTALLVPAGFAHGYQCLTDDVELLYLHSAFHDAASERGLNPFDPKLAIAWPLTPAAVSDRDSNRAMIADGFEGERT